MIYYALENSYFQETPCYQLTNTVQWEIYKYVCAYPKINNTFSKFDLFLTKQVTKWSRAPGHFLGGQWVEHKAEF